MARSRPSFTATGKPICPPTNIRSSCQPPGSPPLSPPFQKTYARSSEPPYIPLIPSHCEVATNGLRGELGITEVAPWWAKAGAEAAGTVPPPSTRRMPESTPTRRRDEGPISCRLPAWTLVPPRPLQIPAASSLTSPDGPADASARPQIDNPARPGNNPRMMLNQLSVPLSRDQAYALVDAVMERDDLALTA